MVSVPDKFFAWSCRFSLRTKLAVGFAATIALTLLVGTTSLLSQERARRAIDTFFDSDDKISELSLKSNAAMLKARKAEQDFLLKFRDLDFFEAKSRYATLVRVRLVDIRQNMVAIRKLTPDREVNRRTHDIERAADRYEAGFLRVVELYGDLGCVNNGLEGAFRIKAHEIENIIKQHHHDGLMSDLLSLRRHEKDFILRGLDLYVGELAQGVAKFRTDVLRTGLPYPQKEKLILLINDYHGLFGQYVRAKGKIRAEMSDYLAAVHAIEPGLEYLYLHASRHAFTTRSSMQQLTRVTGWTIIGASLVAVMAGMVVALLISRSITRSVRKCVDFADLVAAGDLGTRITPDTEGSEFGALSGALNRMADKLQNMRLAQQQRAGELTEINKALEIEVCERKRTTNSLGRSNRALRILSACNALLVHATEESGLSDDICRNIVEIGGYTLAWVGYLPGTQEMNHEAQAVHEGRCPVSIFDSCENTAHVKCRFAAALIPQKGIAESPPLDLAYASWLSRETGVCCTSAVAFPLKGDKGVFGTLNIHATHPDAFDEEEVRLLAELADHLAFGISTLRAAIDRKRAEEVLKQRQKAIESSSNGILITDPTTHDNPIIYVNPAFERITGYTAQEALGQNGRFLLGDDREQLGLVEIRAVQREQREGHAVLRNYRKDGSLFWNELAISPLWDDRGVLINFVGIINDITEQKCYEEQLEYQANHDGLTNLPNRNLLADRIGQALLYAQRQQRQAAILFVDLDNFKFINDSLGHNVGDSLLKIVAKRIESCIRSIDTVARHGGDEFVVVLSDLGQSDDVAIVAAKITDAVSRPLTIDDHELEISCSTGISIYPKDGIDGQTLLKNADAAMYRAKEHGRNNFQFYTEELNDKVVARMTMEKHLRRALERDEFFLHYQPQVDLNTGNVTGMEALIRWQSPELGFVPPDGFISLAEETGLIVPIGEWVLKAACRQNKAWQDAGLSPLTMAVNLSPRQFRQENLCETVAGILQETGLAAQYLELEIVESLLMHDVRCATVMINELKGLGVRITMDDFGTGYSNLSYLKLFPFDKLKIDQCFVRNITIDPDSAAIAKAMIALAHSLKLRVIAEGIETEGQLHYLRSHRCDEMQGYYFSRPVPAREFELMLREKRRLDLRTGNDRPSERTALLVDDEPHIISALERLLSGDGYNILTVNSATQGFESLAINRVGVIVADQCMPEMTGTEFLSRCRELYPDAVRVLLTGHPDLDIVTEAVNNGAIYKFLVKPWDDEQLKRCIADAFERYRLAVTKGKTCRLDSSLSTTAA